MNLHIAWRIERTSWHISRPSNVISGKGLNLVTVLASSAVRIVVYPHYVKMTEILPTPEANVHTTFVAIRLVAVHFRSTPNKLHVLACRQTDVLHKTHACICRTSCMSQARIHERYIFPWLSPRSLDSTIRSWPFNGRWLWMRLWFRIFSTVSTHRTSLYHKPCRL